MKITFLMTHVPNPRMNKRIHLAAGMGDVHAICISRADADIWEPHYRDIQHHIIPMNMVSAKKPLRRLRCSIEYGKTALPLLKQIAPDCIYAESLDSLYIAVKYKKRHEAVAIVYEVADLREVFVSDSKSLATKAIRHIEKKLFAHVDLLTVTSMSFYEKHYNAFLPVENCVYMPNMPDLSAFKQYKKKAQGMFTIGFIGAVRYLKQMKMLVDAAEACNVRVLFAGGAASKQQEKEIIDYCEGKRNIEITGKYDYYEDIANLYGRVDCVYAVYDADNPNVCIALPNKLYEAVYCELPIIIAKGTYLSDVVADWGVGVSVSHTETSELVDAIARLRDDAEYYEQFVRNCKAHKPEIDEQKYGAVLKSKMLELAGKKEL